MQPVSSVRFKENAPKDFFAIVNQRVNDYFKTNQIDRYGNSEMVLKTIFMYVLYFVPYLLMVTGVVTSPWAWLVLAVVMGHGLAGIGLSVMHDANHGAYSRKSWVNRLIGYSMNVVGGHDLNWRIQHNVLHHTYTNIEGHDEDIAPRGVLRFSPHSKYLLVHKFQFLYAWFFYGLMTFSWVTLKDFKQLAQFHKMGLVTKQKSNFWKELGIIALTKAVYVVYIVIIPLTMMDITWWQLLIGFMVMHYIGGLILATIFQPAHVVEESLFPLPDVEGRMENTWAVHQMYTTVNFAQRAPLFSWYVGGLNHQIEHHLFPHVCHVHYRKIAPIVEQTAKDFGLPYHQKPTFAHALWSHAKLLWKLGKRDFKGLQVAT
jgi:linoleoyl-CoA desaturase